MASIRKRVGKKGTTYLVQIRVQGYEPVHGSFKTKKEATEFVRKMEGDMDKYAHITGSVLKQHTLKDPIDQFAKTWKKKDQNTLNRIYYWKDKYGHMKLTDFTNDFVKSALDTLRKEKDLADPTVNRYLSAISSVFHKSIDKGWFGIKTNPCEKIGRGEETNRFGTSLSNDEIQRLLEACDNSVCKALPVLFRLALATGARKGELLKLEWSDVDVERQRLYFRDTKNGTDRIVPVIDQAWESLMTWTKREDSELVFPGKNPKSGINFQKSWTKAKEEAGIENYRWHDNRHTCASHLADNGVSVMQIGAILGHKTLTMVNRYSHRNTAGMENVINKGVKL